MLLGPPMLSHDVYSYASQGEMASRGIDPTANGPFSMKHGRWVWEVDPIWRDAPAPYGPVAVEAGKLVVEATGHDAASAIWGFRALAMFGVMLAAVGIASIARSMKQSPAVAVAVGIASPLVLLHLIGGSHNDALMMGLLALGVAAFLRKRKWLGMALVILATGAKVPAAAGIVFLAWNWLDDPDTTIWQRVKTTAYAGLGSLAAISVLSVLVGIQVGLDDGAQEHGQRVLDVLGVDQARLPHRQRPADHRPPGRARRARWPCSAWSASPSPP